MDVKVYKPHLVLQPYIHSISTVHVVLPVNGRDVVTPYPPTPFQSLIFYCNHPVSMNRLQEETFQQQPITVIVGPQYSRVNINVHEQLRAIRVDFLPGGMFHFFRIPMHELFDKGLDATDILGPRMKHINERLRSASTLEEGKIIIENFLLSFISASSPRLLPFDEAMRWLLNQHGNASIDKVASLSCLGIKQFERKCKERIGMNPKMYARVLKFSKAYRMHEAFPQLSWTKIAYEAGYFDQMHMIKDFRVFAGVNPTVIEHQLLNTPIRMQKDL